MQGLTAGRIVHVVLSNGEHRPGIITKVLREDYAGADVGVQVFLHPDDAETHSAINPYAEDTFARLPLANTCLNLAEVPYSEDPKPHTWHWIERD